MRGKVRPPWNRGCSPASCISHKFGVTAEGRGFNPAEEQHIDSILFHALPFLAPDFDFSKTLKHPDVAVRGVTLVG